jgi:hypothetical protein
LQRMRSPTLKEIRFGGEGQLDFSVYFHFIMLSWKRLETKSRLWMTLLRYSII